MSEQRYNAFYFRAFAVIGVEEVKKLNQGTILHFNNVWDDPTKVIQHGIAKKWYGSATDYSSYDKLLQQLYSFTHSILISLELINSHLIIAVNPINSTIIIF